MQILMLLHFLICFFLLLLFFSNLPLHTQGYYLFLFFVSSYFCSFSCITPNSPPFFLPSCVFIFILSRRDKFERDFSYYIFPQDLEWGKMRSNYLLTEGINRLQPVPCSKDGVQSSPGEYCLCLKISESSQVALKIMLIMSPFNDPSFSSCQMNYHLLNMPAWKLL